MTAFSRPFAIKFRPIFSPKGRWVGTMTPRKLTQEDGGEAHIEKEEAEPIAALRKPPPLPPVLGPLFALSVLESWTNRDKNDD